MNVLSFLTEDVQLKIAKVSCLLIFVHGLVMVLAPQKEQALYASKEYEKPDDGTLKKVRYNTQYANLTLLSISISWWLHAEKGLTPEQAIGVTCMPWIVLTLFNLLNEVPTKLGRNNRPSFMLLLLNVPVVFLNIVRDDMTQLGTLAIKGMSIWTLTNGIMFMFCQSMLGTVYGVPEDNDHVTISRKRVGCNLIAMSVFQIALIWNVPHLLALGMAWAAAFVFNTMLVNDHNKMKLDMPSIYGWLVAMVFFAFSLSFRQLQSLTVDMAEKEKDE